MFGKEFSNQTYILMQSFEQMNDAYKEKIQGEGKDNNFLSTLQKVYISLFGIPEIGFQLRSLYFSRIISSHLSRHLYIILDAGSGIGAYAIWLGKRFRKARVIAGDIDREKLQSTALLIKKLQLSNVMISYLDITKMQAKTTYDLIVSIDVLEHVDNYQIALKNLYRLLKKNGYIYIHVPQPNQTRIFSSLNMWRHQDHIHEGISKKDLEKTLKKLEFKIISSKETFGFFGKLAWELNHIAISKSFIFAGFIYPFLYILAVIDTYWQNKNGLGVAILAQKKGT